MACSLDLGEFTDRAAITVDNLNAILVSGRSISQKIDRGEGLVGRLLNHPKFSKQMSRLLSSVTELFIAMKSGRGSFWPFSQRFYYLSQHRIFHEQFKRPLPKT